MKPAPIISPSISLRSYIFCVIIYQFNVASHTISPKPRCLCTTRKRHLADTDSWAIESLLSSNPRRFWTRVTLTKRCKILFRQLNRFIPNPSFQHSPLSYLHPSLSISLTNENQNLCRLTCRKCSRILSSVNFRKCSNTRRNSQILNSISH